ncbi:hypothetical protein MHYP_G00242190 [Metynnis hypsauchen]
MTNRVTAGIAQREQEMGNRDHYGYALVLTEDDNAPLPHTAHSSTPSPEQHNIPTLTNQDTHAHGLEISSGTRTKKSGSRLVQNRNDRGFSSRNKLQQLCSLKQCGSDLQQSEISFGGFLSNGHGWRLEAGSSLDGKRSPCFWSERTLEVSNQAKKVSEKIQTADEGQEVGPREQASLVLLSPKPEPKPTRTPAEFTLNVTSPGGPSVGQENLLGFHDPVIRPRGTPPYFSAHETYSPLCTYARRAAVRRGERTSEWKERG